MELMILGQSIHSKDVRVSARLHNYAIKSHIVIVKILYMSPILLI